MIRRGVWPALVLALFCLPLFVGLGSRDLQNDEATYSFTVDRILETGQWLELHASPHEEGVPFLEKPPLKFWIVAAPIKLGLLPHDEFGLRFWDAVFASLSFLYVFLIGRRVLNPLAGGVAALVLFAHQPLLFEHGLRDNGMDAPLVLCYCGGIYHYLTWTSAERRSKGWLHLMATGLYFVLGFMTKFVAAIFLPMIVTVSALALATTRAKLKRDWLIWLSSVALSVALMTPWFVWANARYGSSYWDAILAEHVYQRFAGYLDPSHVQPWYYYFTTVYGRWSSSGTFWLAAAGCALVAYQTVKRQWVEGITLLTWFVLPVVLISGGTSKLYHYLYPFLPPLAIAVGYLIAMLFALAFAPFDRALSRLYDRLPRLMAAGRWPPVRAALMLTVAASLGLLVLSLMRGQIRVELGPVVFRNTSVFRPAMVAFLFALPLGLNRRTRALIFPLLIACLLPWPSYRATLVALDKGEHPYRSTSSCLQQVDAELAGAPRGLYFQRADPWIWHSVYYYFRHVTPWTRSAVPSAENMNRFLHDPDAQRPILLPTAEGHVFFSADSKDPVALDLGHDLTLLMPGPYRKCQGSE